MIAFKILMLVLSLIGVCLVPLSLPGTWLIVGGAALYSIFFDFVPAGGDFWVVGILVLIGIIGEILEYLVQIIGAKTLKISTGAIISSILGGILGALIGVPVFLIGSLLGLMLGVFLGAFVYEWLVTKDFAVALKTSLGVFFSRMVASFMKTGLAVGMVVYLGFRLF